MILFTTTVYPKVYPPKPLPENSEPWELVSYIVLLAHEGQHLFDRKAAWWFFNLAYLSPQIFAVLALLSLINIWWLFALVFLAPIPSVGRAIIEIRGYNVSIATVYWLGWGKLNVEHIVNNFCNGNYYFMFPLRKYLTRKFEKTHLLVSTNQPLPKYLERFRLVLKFAK